MSGDIKLLILAGIGIAAGAWLLTYSSQAAALGAAGAQDYAAFVHGLEPSASPMSITNTAPGG